MKYALVLLVIASALITWRFSKSTAHFTIRNISVINDTTDVTVSVDKEVIFSGLVDEVQTSKFHMRLWKGKHSVEVKANNHNNNNIKLAYGKEIELKGNAWINIIYQAKYTIDLATNGNALKRTLDLQIKD